MCGSFWMSVEGGILSCSCFFLPILGEESIFHDTFRPFDVFRSTDLAC